MRDIILLRVDLRITAVSKDDKLRFHGGMEIFDVDEGEGEGRCDEEVENERDDVFRP